MYLSLSEKKLETAVKNCLTVIQKSYGDEDLFITAEEKKDMQNMIHLTAHVGQVLRDEFYNKEDPSFLNETAFNDMKISSATLYFRPEQKPNDKKEISWVIRNTCQTLNEILLSYKSTVDNVDLNVAKETLTLVYENLQKENALYQELDQKSADSTAY